MLITFLREDNVSNQILSPAGWHRHSFNATEVNIQAGPEKKHYFKIEYNGVSVQ